MQTQAAQLKRDIEAQLAGRIAGALSPMPVQTPRLHPTGIAHLDALLGGGFPLAAVCELTGRQGSGQTSIALSLLSIASKEGACAYIDVSDRMSPHGAAAMGVQLRNLLWVRFPHATALPASPREIKPSPATQASPEERRPIHSGCGGSHPRKETKALAPALQQMLLEKDDLRRRKMEGTPGHPNQPIGLHTASKEQVDWERFNLRRVDETDPLRILDKQAAEEARSRAAYATQQSIPRQSGHRSLERIGSALRATDQVLQSGGFRVVVLDLISVSLQDALRIPSATWFRYRRAAQESDTILLLLTQEPCARSSAACVLTCSAGLPPVVDGVLAGAQRVAEVARQRTAPAFGKKAPGRETGWSAAPAWVRTGAS